MSDKNQSEKPGAVVPEEIRNFLLIKRVKNLEQSVAGVTEIKPDEVEYLTELIGVMRNFLLAFPNSPSRTNIRDLFVKRLIADNRFTLSDLDLFYPRPIPPYDEV